ncbi:hypothetical protein CRENBAI_001027 [Crenichthys baileyi]|uniref:Uncharacterized protein n=1 Tax=Crenichthys baileyi TaxID=28760 RepID=A0AAV9S3C2_9TELE
MYLPAILGGPYTTDHQGSWRCLGHAVRPNPQRHTFPGPIPCYPGPHRSNSPRNPEPQATPDCRESMATGPITFVCASSKTLHAATRCHLREPPKPHPVQAMFRWAQKPILNIR